VSASESAGRRPFVGQFVWVTGGRIFAAVLQAVSLVLVLQRISPSEFGVLSAVLGLATVVQTAIDMGVATFITRERAANPDSGAIATALRFNMLSSLVLTAVVLLALGTAGLFNPIYFFLLPLAFWVSGERNADARLAVVFADGDAKINVFNLVSRRCATILVFLGLAGLQVEPLLAFAVASAVAALASSLFANIYVKGRVRTPSSISYRELLRESRPYWVNSVATQARNLDVTIAGIVAGATQAGYYSTAARLTSPLRILPTSLASVLLPAATRASAKSQSLRPLLKIVGIVLLVMTVVYAGIWVLIPWGVPTFLGTAYSPAIPSVQLVVAGLPFAAAASLFSSLLQGRGHKRFVALVATVSTGVCLVCVAVAAPIWGAQGAALALSVSFMVQAGVLALKFARSAGDSKR
jgi:O-antigen/teichoic acid export membrane protein